jgi:secreted trypsin-like serine protease
MLALKSSSAKLRLVGYGATDNSGTNSSIPRFLDAQFSQATAGSTQPNSSFAQTTYGDLCAGDSGGPVLYITATSVVVVGVLTGSYGSGLCDEKNSNGNYYALFTLLNRYSNLAFSAALNVMNSDETSLGDALTSSAQLGKDLGASKVNIDSLTNLVEVKNGIIDDKSKLVATLQNQISDLLAQISRMKTQIPTTITCISGRVTKKITSVKAKCPAGFKLKM